MSEPLPDPAQTGTPFTPSSVDIPGPLFLRVWLVVLLLGLVVACAVLAAQLLG